MDGEEIKKVKSMLRSVLISVKEGINATQLQHDYRDIVGENIPYQRMGFRSFETFILSIPDVARLERRGPDIIIHGVADETTSHIKALVSKQRSKKVRKPVRRPRGGGPTRFLRPGGRGGYRPQGTPARYMPRTTLPSFISPPFVHPPFGHSLTPVTISVGGGARTIRVGSSPMFNKAMSDANKERVNMNRPSQQAARFEVPPRFRNRIGAQPTPQQQQRQQAESTPRRPIQSKPPPAKMLDGEVYVNVLAEHLQEINQPLQFDTLEASGGYVSSVKIRQSTYGSGDIFRTAKEAEAAAAKNAVEELNIQQKQQESRLQPIDWNETGGYSPVLDWADEMSREETGGGSLPREQIVKVKSRIKEILDNKKNGLWATRIPHEYKERYKEEPPADLIKLIKSWSDVAKVEAVANTDRELVYPVIEDPNMHLEIPKDLLISSEDPVTVYMTYVSNPGYFCVQREDSVIDDIAEHLQTHCQSANCPPAKELEKGRFCAALFSGDGAWTRAEILEHKPNGTVELLFVDYGNVECVKEDDVRWLSPDLAKYPCQAINCSLCGIQPLQGETGWSDAASKLFAEQVEDQPLLAVPQDADDNTVEVVLYLKSDTNISLNEKLIKDGVVEATKIVSSEDDETSLHPADLVLPDEKEWDVHVTYISSSTESVMLRLVGEDYSDRLDAYQAKLQEAFRNSSSEAPIVEGHTYIAYDDGLYHRVRVMSQDGKKVQCYFLDHGDTDELLPEQLLPIDPQINKNLPYQAVEVSLYGLEEVCTNITALEKICDIALGKTCVAEVLDREGRPSVILFDTSGDNDININETILRTIEAEGGGIDSPRTESPSPGNSSSSTPQRVLSPVPRSSNTVEKSNSGDKLDTNSNPIVQTAQTNGFSKETSVVVDNFVNRSSASQENSPNVSQTLEVSVNSDTSVSSDVSMKSKSSEAQDTALNAIRPILGRSPNSKGKVETIANDNEPKPFQIPEVGEYLDVHVNFVHDPSQFVCIPYDEMNKLNRVLLDMIEFYNVPLQPMSESDIELGKLYAGHKDGIWYRVKVCNEVGSDLVSVYLVDIGEYSVMMLSEIQPLPQQFRKLPLMAFNATLGSIVPAESDDWYEAAKYKFIELARDKDLIGLVQGKDETSGVVNLRLIDTSNPTQDICIDEVLVNLQYAKLK